MSPSMSMGSPAIPSHRNSHKTDSPVDAVDRHDFGVQKNRKYPSTGGGRAWTEDEEVYLLQTRLQKMPYKHIAAHLKKTELACRLHYHQLSHGTNRRKRTASFSSSSTQSPLTSEQRLSPDADISTAPTTPEQRSSERPEAAGGWKGRTELPEPSSTVSHLGHTPILPKPIPSLPYPMQSSHMGLRLDCGVAAACSNPPINRDRLREVYEAHRASFWKMIAADYGDNADPVLLEETWRKGFVQGPPTPDDVSGGMKFGPLIEDRVVLPALHTTRLEHSFSPSQPRMSVASSIQSYSARSSFKLPTPSTASTDSSMMSAGSIPSTAIAALLNNSIEPERLPSIDGDVDMEKRIR